MTSLALHDLSKPSDDDCAIAMSWSNCLFHTSAASVLTAKLLEGSEWLAFLFGGTALSDVPCLDTVFLKEKWFWWKCCSSTAKQKQGILGKAFSYSDLPTKTTNQVWRKEEPQPSSALLSGIVVVVVAAAAVVVIVIIVLIINDDDDNNNNNNGTERCNSTGFFNLLTVLRTVSNI